MWLKKLVVALLFVAFIPGVLVTLPQGGKKWTVLGVHALLFVLTTHIVMKSFQFEYMGNFGDSCPASHVMDEEGNCHAKPMNGSPMSKHE